MKNQVLINRKLQKCHLLRIIFLLLFFVAVSGQTISKVQYKSVSKLCQWSTVTISKSKKTF